MAEVRSPSIHACMPWTQLAENILHGQHGSLELAGWWAGRDLGNEGMNGIDKIRY